MPELGEISKGDRSRKIIWLACPCCGKARWVPFIKGAPQYYWCHFCVKKSQKESLNYNWKGGRYKSKRHGYVFIRLQPDDFFYPMVDCVGYVREHRLVMASHLGRCLQPWEIVHHKNGIRDDNRIENLQLIQEMQHTQTTILGNKIDSQSKQIQELKDLIEELRKEIRWLRFENNPNKILERDK